MLIKNVVVALVVVCFAFAGGNPDVYVDDNGNESKYEDVVRMSSYQRLKKKYTSEVEYTTELKGRINNLTIKLHDSESNLSECLSSEPLIIQQDKIVEKVVTVKEQPIEYLILSVIIGFIIGKAF